jgi:signal recognition particle subunit SRP54
MKKMGGMGALMGMMPGMGQMKKAMAGAKLDEKVFDRQIAIINSMTIAERADPDLLNAKRRIRISKGSGTKVEDVNKLMKQHRQMADMMKKVGKGGMGALSGMFGGKMGQMMPGLGGMDPSKLDPAQLEAMAKQMGMDPKAIAGAAGAAAPKDISNKLPSDVGQLLKSGSGMPGLGGTSRFPGLPGLGGGFVPKKK